MAAAAPGTRRARWARELEASWWLARRPAWPLRWLAACFGWVGAVRRCLYRNRWLRSVVLDVPVVVVGNRIVGGAGKTPTLLALIDALRQAGWHPGVVSRGHGRQGDEPLAVTPIDNASHCGDEPLLIARRSGAPVWVGRDRANAGQCLLRAHPEVNVLLCDDGLQHLRLARDAELIVFDDRGAGNGHLLPAGPLREPIDAAGLTAHRWVLYNARTPSTPLPGALAERSLARPRLLTDWQAGRPAAIEWTALQTRPVWALAGIGSPQRFFSDLQAQGLQLPIDRQLPMPDHAAYEQLPWPSDVADLLLTEKDAVKLDPARLARQRPHTRVWVVTLQYRLPESLVQSLLTHLSHGRRPQAR